MLSSFALVGLFGSAIYFISYYLLNAEFIKGNSWQYIGSNLLAAILVLFSLYENWNLPSFIIQAGWAGLSIYGLTKLQLKNKKEVEQ